MGNIDYRNRAVAAYIPLPRIKSNLMEEEAEEPQPKPLTQKDKKLIRELNNAALAVGSDAEGLREKALKKAEEIISQLGA